MAGSGGFKGESKACAKCGKPFFRPIKISKAQWDKRTFCSKACASTKRVIEDDNVVVSMYESGMSCHEIAPFFLTSSTNISRILHKCGADVEKYRIKKGGISVTEYGYLRFNHTKANGSNAGRRLHDIIAEMKIGRPLSKDEIVHHLDGDKLNNHPNNLVVMTRGQHTTLHKKRVA